MKPILTFLFVLIPVCPGFTKDKPPNVVTLYVDDLGYRDIACYGGEIPTPNLDAMAANGLRFERFYAGGPVVRPTLARSVRRSAWRRTRAVFRCTRRERRWAESG